MSCLGDVVAALVDGELDHAARERAHRHLAHCARCRTEVDAQRRLKARLSIMGHDPAPSAALTARLVALRTAGPVVPTAIPTPTGLPTLPAALRPPVLSARPTDARPLTPRPTPGPSRGRARRVRRRAKLGTAVLALGLGAALALGGPGASRARPPGTPVEPASDVFVVDVANTTGGIAGRR